MARAESLDQFIILNEVERCVQYAVIAGKVNSDLVDYWRENRATDKRYTFKITDRLFTDFGFILVKYRGLHFMVTNGKAVMTGN